MLTFGSAVSMDALPALLDTSIQLVAFFPVKLAQAFIQASSDLIQGGFMIAVTGFVNNFINTLS